MLTSKLHQDEEILQCTICWQENIMLFWDMTGIILELHVERTTVNSTSYCTVIYTIQILPSAPHVEECFQMWFASIMIILTFIMF
jgi:hypothetical protein